MALLLTSVATPPGNTGSEPLAAAAKGFSSRKEWRKLSRTAKISGHPDYLILCGSIMHLHELEALVWAVFGTKFDWLSARPGTRGKYYESNAASPIGLTISLNDLPAGQGVEYRLVIPGKPMAHVLPQKLHEFGRRMLALGAKCTRFDWAIDDFSRSLDIDVLYNACLDGNRHGFDSYTYYATGSRRHKSLGKTLYLGAFGTDYFARIYDKNVESKGQINAIRFEVQTADEIADSFFAYYFCEPDLSLAVLNTSKRAIGKYRFVEHTSRDLQRCKDCDWWGVFVRLVGGQIKISVPRLQPMISDKKRWIERQVSGSLALIGHCIGDDNLWHWLQQIVKEKQAYCVNKNNLYRDTWRDRIVVAGHDIHDSIGVFLSSLDTPHQVIGYFDCLLQSNYSMSLISTVLGGIIGVLNVAQL